MCGTLVKPVLICREDSDLRGICFDEVTGLLKQ